MFFDFREDRAGYHCRSLGAAWRETRPVVEIDDGEGAVGEDDGVAAVDPDVEGFGGAVANLLEPVVVKLRLPLVGAAGLA